MKENNVWNKLKMVFLAAAFAALAGPAAATTEAVIDLGSRPAPVARPSSSHVPESNPPPVSATSAAESLSDEQLLAIARRKADGFAAQGDFERADRIMEQAQRYIERRRGSTIPDNIPDSLKDLYGRASHGDPEAQFLLGQEYKRGKNISKNTKEAVQWWHKAAEQGHVLAQCGLGLLYYGGVGVSEDASEAVKWFTKAAEQGDSTSQYFLGMMTFNGVGTPANGAKAIRLLQEAADQGHADAKKIVSTLVTLADLTPELRGPNCAVFLKNAFELELKLPSVEELPSVK